MNRTPIIQGEGIFTLIPQRPPIVMVDSFCGIENDCSYSGLTITADNIFCQDGKFQEAGVIEHIAQEPHRRGIVLDTIQPAYQFFLDRQRILMEPGP